jgi:SAM-dependent methyltransferase
MPNVMYRLLEFPAVYALNQMIGAPTVRRYRAMIARHLPQDSARRIIEIGCGLGTARPLFGPDYTGIDINAAYINKARQNFSGTFCVVDAAQLPFAPKTFDDAFSIATTHHLTDEQLSSMVREAVAIASFLHIVDAILPLSSRSWFKNAYFRMDRGRFPRTIDRLRDVVGRNARLEYFQTLEGPLHDVCYIRASRMAAALPS